MTTEKRPLVLAHRGGAGLAPENSLEAFAGAARMGADGVELDVHMSADGAVVVIHDETLERTTTGRGPVAARDAGEIAALRLKQNGEAVPMLDDVLVLLAPTRLLVDIEIKCAARGRPYEGLEEGIARSLDKAGMGARAVISCFDWGRVTRFLEIARPAKALGLLTRRGVGEAGGITRALERAAAAGFDGICVHAGALPRRPLAEGGRVWTYGAEDEAAISGALASGAGAVITDRPDIALRLRP